MYRHLSIFALVTITSPALAAELGGVTVADSVTVDDRRLELNGMGQRLATMFNVEVYVAALYVVQRSSEPTKLLANPWRLELHFSRDVERDDVAGAFTKAASRKGKTLGPKLSKLAGMMTAMKKGDVLRMTHAPGAGLGVEVRGVKKGTIDGDDFARGILGGFIGARPPNPSLKAGLLGK